MEAWLPWRWTKSTKNAERGQIMDSRDIGNKVTSRSYEGDDVRMNAAKGLVDVSLQGSLVMTDDEIHITAPDYSVPIERSGATEGLLLKFVGQPIGQDLLIDLVGKTGSQIEASLARLRPMYDNQFRIVHMYREADGRLVTYEFMLETENNVHILWASKVLGFGKKVIHDVPIVLIQTASNKRKYDVHVLRTNILVAKRKYVKFTMVRNITSGMDNAEQIDVVWQKALHDADEQMTVYVEDSYDDIVDNGYEELQ